MDRVHPDHTPSLDAYRAYRPSQPPGRPFLRINMVSSLDGHVVDADGVSSTLGGAGDRAAFFAMRHLADGVLAGAGTVRAEDYGGMRIRDAMRDQREADGRDGPAPIIVVTRSVDLDPSSRLFTDTDVPPVVVTTVNAPSAGLESVRSAGATIVQAGEGDVDLAAGLAILRRDHGLHHLLCEGGPTLNGQLISAGLVDEICLTLGPMLAGGDDDKRVVHGLADRHAATLVAVHREGDELLLRYALSAPNWPRSAT